MLAEENRGGPAEIGKAMLSVLLLTAVAFSAQTWVAALLVPDPARLMAEGDAAGTAFYDAARVAGGEWLATLTAVATALAWGVANNMVAQVATSRLLFAMGRDGQLPRWLAKVSPRRAVPANAVMTVAAVSLGLSLYMASRDDGIALLSSLVTFGAICAFVVLNCAVPWHYFRRERERSSLVLHLLIPAAAVVILLAIAWHANYLAQMAAGVWLAVGVLVLLGLYATGRKPSLSGMAKADEPVSAGQHV
jgi:amino acid transporter